ncbi:MAG: hypothetical protein GY791_10605, partial [Alphaproteobacteria bacterium]|nr:hypothetical protein [Alphaproteobacteria bacterium]
MAARVDDAKLANLSNIPSKFSPARPAASLKTTLLVGAATVAVAARRRWRWRRSCRWTRRLRRTSGDRG